MWEEGTFVMDDVLFKYQAKVFKESSELGINNGRISKLEVTKELGDNKWHCELDILLYDRGWVIEPSDSTSKKALHHILDLYK